MMTGNYRIGFTDPGPDIGNTLHLRTIANPHTNAIETIEISQDTSMMGLHKKYTLYLKIRGVWDEILKTSLLGKKPKETIFLKEFVEILKKNSLKLHRRPLNVEIILFSDDKAVFTTQYTKKHFNNKSYFQCKYFPLSKRFYGRSRRPSARFTCFQKYIFNQIGAMFGSLILPISFNFCNGNGRPRRPQ